MKISIITAVKNNERTVEECVTSVLDQSYSDIEYIVIDGASTDKTLEILNTHKDRISKIVSEKDTGLYDAMNKGIRLATGDVIGFLHGDDIYPDTNVIEEVAKKFTENGVETVYGDLLYVDRSKTDRIIRRWTGGQYKHENLKLGWMPPHPTFFVRRDIYNKYGPYNTDYRIAADYEMMLRLLYKNGVSAGYIPRVLVKMRIGGLSNMTIENMIKKSAEDYRICRDYGLGYHALLMKNLTKIPQFFIKAERSVKNRLDRYLKIAKKYYSKGQPLSLIYFVTKACNCRCEHCFYWQSLNKGTENELTLEEVDAITRKLGQLLYVRFSGGEPFIRGDLFEIVRSFSEHCHPVYFGIPTNGFFTDTIVDFARKASEIDAYVEIGISIDDFEEHHDKIRACPGIFKAAIRTFQELKNIQKETKNLGVGFITTAMKSNQPRLKELFHYLASLGPDSIACNIIRDDTKIEEEKELDWGLTGAFADLCDEYNNRSLGQKRGFIQKLRMEKTEAAHRVRSEVIRTGRFQIPCVAGDKMVVMYSEGEIAPCETLNEQMGNIRDYGYDMRKLLKSERARAIRKKIIDGKCFCTHECFTSASITFSAREMAKVFMRSLKP